jgi:hypothetical protein
MRLLTGSLIAFLIVHTETALAQVPDYCKANPSMMACRCRTESSAACDMFRQGHAISANDLRGLPDTATKPKPGGFLESMTGLDSGSKPRSTGRAEPLLAQPKAGRIDTFFDQPTPSVRSDSFRAELNARRRSDSLLTQYLQPPPKVREEPGPFTKLWESIKRTASELVQNR